MNAHEWAAVAWAISFLAALLYLWAIAAVISKAKWDRRRPQCPGTTPGVVAARHCQMNDGHSLRHYHRDSEGGVTRWPK